MPEEDRVRLYGGREGCGVEISRWSSGLRGVIPALQIVKEPDESDRRCCGCVLSRVGELSGTPSSEHDPIRHQHHAFDKCHLYPSTAEINSKNFESVPKTGIAFLAARMKGSAHRPPRLSTEHQMILIVNRRITDRP